MGALRLWTLAAQRSTCFMKGRSMASRSDDCLVTRSNSYYTTHHITSLHTSHHTTLLHTSHHTSHHTTTHLTSHRTTPHLTPHFTSHHSTSHIAPHIIPLHTSWADLPHSTTNLITRNIMTLCNVLTLYMCSMCCSLHLIDSEHCFSGAWCAQGWTSRDVCVFITQRDCSTVYAHTSTHHIWYMVPY